MEQRAWGMGKSRGQRHGACMCQFERSRELCRDENKFNPYWITLQAGINRSRLRSTRQPTSPHALCSMPHAFYAPKKSAFSSVASSGFILPARIKRNCLRLSAPSNRFCSSSVSGSRGGTGSGEPFRSSATKV